MEEVRKGHQAALLWQSSRTRCNPCWSVKGRRLSHDAKTYWTLPVYVERKEGPTTVEKCQLCPDLQEERQSPVLWQPLRHLPYCPQLARSQLVSCSNDFFNTLSRVSSLKAKLVSMHNAALLTYLLHTLAPGNKVQAAQQPIHDLCPPHQGLWYSQHWSGLWKEKLGCPSKVIKHLAVPWQHDGESTEQWRWLEAFLVSNGTKYGCVLALHCSAWSFLLCWLTLSVPVIITIYTSDTALMVNCSVSGAGSSSKRWRRLSSETLLFADDCALSANTSRLCITKWTAFAEHEKTLASPSDSA